MKEKLLLVGSGGFGRVVLEHASQTYDCAFLDDAPEIGTLIDGTPVIGRTEELENFYGEYRLLLVTIGNNRIREKLYQKAEQVGYEFPNIIVPSAYVSPHAVLGKGVILLNNAVVQNGARIGNGSILNPGVEAHQDSTIGNNVVIYTNSVIRSLAVVEDRARIGSLVTVATQAVVPEDTDVPDGTVAGE